MLLPMGAGALWDGMSHLLLHARGQLYMSRSNRTISKCSLTFSANTFQITSLLSRPGWKTSFSWKTLSSTSSLEFQRILTMFRVFGDVTSHVLFLCSSVVALMPLWARLVLLARHVWYSARGGRGDQRCLATLWYCVYHSNKIKWQLCIAISPALTFSTLFFMLCL